MKIESGKNKQNKFNTDNKRQWEYTRRSDRIQIGKENEQIIRRGQGLTDSSNCHEKSR